MAGKYPANKRWRLSHPKTRYAQKQRYYRKHRPCSNGWKRWSKAEEILITQLNRPCDVVFLRN